MVQSLITVVKKWLNVFPSKGSISDTMRPSTIVEVKPNPDICTQRILFGSYALVYIGSDNTMKRRSVPGISLNESNEH